MMETHDAEPRGGFPPMRTWQEPTVRNPGGGAEYGDMICALRNFLDDVAAAAPDAAALVTLTDDLNRWAERLAESAVPERRQIFARRLDLPGRGQTMSPCFTPIAGDRETVTGTVTFGRYFLGGGGAVHGGAIPLLFDEVLGRLASSGGRAPARTAYLHTDFRSITPVGAELAVRAWFVSEQGRKRILRAELTHGDTLCAEAEGLFIELRPDQP
ncbi:PaaI family thioesterase [Mycobacterium avium subsp. hominissuis]|nr:MULTISPECIES: hotdog domain-containing protein [Mycobacterium avium complex (MAC)]ETB18178.1 thioesterase [Mycobacterium avium 09-5983]ETB36410.1 thioesterase [Mycobacterium avium subsp. hominissuis 10-5606]MDV3218700.1 PaaI family thioesterase [Mycobacterium avium]